MAYSRFCSVSSLILCATLAWSALPVQAQIVVAGSVPDEQVVRERALAEKGNADALVWLGNAFLTGQKGLPCDPMVADALFLYAQRTHHHKVPGMRALEAGLKPGQRAQAEWLAQRESAHELLAVIDGYLQH